MKRTELPLQFTNKGEKLFGVLHLPSASGKYPCVVMCHGFTGNKAEDHFLFTKTARKLAEKGIAAFRFDFRGSGDSEGAFERMTVGTEISDAKEAVKFIKKHKNIDKNSIGLVGLSMGGFVAAYLSGNIPGIKAVALWSAVGRYEKDFGKNLKVNFRAKNLKAKDIGGVVLGKGFFKAGIWYDGLNLISVNEYKEPLLIVHSDNDKAVPFSDAELYYKTSGSKVKELKKIAGGGHTYGERGTEPEVIDYTVKWMKKHLAGKSKLRQK